MAFIIEHTAQGFDNGNGKFLACHEVIGTYLDASCEAMSREHAMSGVLIEGKAIQYWAQFEPVRSQEEFDAMCRKLRNCTAPRYYAD